MKSIYLHLVLTLFMKKTFCVNIQYFDVFLTRSGLDGKKCKTEHRLFAEDSIKSEISCVAKCNFYTNCRSVFYKSSVERCEFCSDKYENNSGLQDDLGTRYFSDKGFQGTYLIAEKMNYTQTKIYCESHGGYILQVGSAEESQHIADTVGNVTGVWLGYTDIATEGVWVWERPDKATNYTNWKHLSGPYATSGRPDENCAAMLSNYDYGWGDRDCSKWMTVVCEL